MYLYAANAVGTDRRGELPGTFGTEINTPHKDILSVVYVVHIHVGDILVP